MARLLDKKQKVYDFQLTSYGKHLLSTGQYEPVYYSFFDDNIAYDRRYFMSASLEAQNNIDRRIKEDTPYLGTFVHFQEVDKTDYEHNLYSMMEVGEMYTFAGTRNPELREQILLGSTLPFEDRTFVSTLAGEGDGLAAMFFHADVIPLRFKPPQSKYKVDAAIGDAYLDNKEASIGASWKVVVLNGRITSTSEKIFYSSSVGTPDSGLGISNTYQETKNIEIPQVNISVDYKKLVADLTNDTTNIYEDPNRLASSTGIFQDNKTIFLKPQDFIAYVDEVNTEVLNQNFDIEVFQIADGSGTAAPTPASTTTVSPLSTEPEDNLNKKYFFTKIDQVVDSMMITPNPIGDAEGIDRSSLTPESVEYYFDIVTDKNVNKETVCKQMLIYNKSSYYIDTDFDCSDIEQNNFYNDIYGSQVEPEICLD